MSSHRNAVVVVLSYVIGFTTAFIAFGVNTPKLAESPSQSIYGIEEVANEAATALSVEFDEVGMHAVVDGKKRVVSGKLQPGVTAGPGFHSDIPAYQVSPSGKYLYYCEQQTSATNDCHAYIYLVDRDVVKTVRLNEQPFVATNGDAAFIWQANDTLVSDRYQSVAGEPWSLVAK